MEASAASQGAVYTYQDQPIVPIFLALEAYRPARKHDIETTGSVLLENGNSI